MIPPLLAIAKPRFHLFSQMGKSLYDLELLVPVTETQFQSKLIATESFRVSLILGGSRGSNHANKDSLSLSSSSPHTRPICVFSSFLGSAFRSTGSILRKAFPKWNKMASSSFGYIFYQLSTQWKRRFIFPRVPGKVLVLRFHWSGLNHVTTQQPSILAKRWNVPSNRSGLGLGPPLTESQPT